MLYTTMNIDQDSFLIEEKYKKLNISDINLKKFLTFDNIEKFFSNM